MRIGEQHIAVVLGTDRICSYRVSLPATDIDACIGFSRLRFALCVCSLILVCSDIPRTGLGVHHLSDIVTTATPDTGFYYGPYDYPIARIVKTSNSSTLSAYEGFAGAKSINATKVWSYKFDSVSIHLRAFVQELSIQSAWPRCILYMEKCATKMLPLGETFVMLDYLIGAIHDQLFPSQLPSVTSLPYVVLVNSNWIDRIHHYLFSLLGTKTLESRLVSLHYYRLPQNSDALLDVCDLRLPTLHRPWICDLTVRYDARLASAGDSTSTSHIPFSKHLGVRLAQLQKQFPLLRFDVTMLTSYRVRANSGDGKTTRWSFFESEKIEIGTIFRGRDCSAALRPDNEPTPDSECESVVIDDFRYERATLQTDIALWYSVTSLLRVLSQGYIWIRVIALWLGCYKARSSEPKFARTSLGHRIIGACATFFHFPGQIVVYSSWLPVYGYALAHLVDAAVIQINTDIIGASLNGTAKFGFWTYFRAATIQMRNIWYLAVVTKLLALVQVHCLPKPWHLRHGLLGVRGSWLGWIAAWTVLGPYQVLSIRDSRVNLVRLLPPNAIGTLAQLLTHCEYLSEFGVRLDAKMIYEVGVLTVALVVTINILLKFAYRFQLRHSISQVQIGFFSRTHYLPLSVETLFDASALSIFWRIQLTKIPSNGQPNQSSSAVVPLPGNASLSDSQHELSSAQMTACRVCHDGKTGGKWPPIQGCPDHDSVYQIERRTIQVWSMVRLVNLAMLSDPIVWLKLRVIGRELYLYEMKKESQFFCYSSTASYMELPLRPERSEKKALVLLPTNPTQLTDAIGAPMFQHSGFRLLDIVNSASVPWTLLLQCG